MASERGASSTARKADPIAVARLKFSLERNKAEAANELKKYQIEQFISQLEQRAGQQSIMLDKQQSDMDAMQQFRDAEQKRKEKEAQAKAKLEGKKKPPTLSAPAPINMENPQASIADAPFAMENFGMPGGPQPGPPGAQADVTGNTMPANAGALLQQAGQLAPFLTQQTRRQATGLEETMPGVRQFIPREETTTRVSPNVLSARNAALIQLQLAQDKQKSHELWLDRIATAVTYADRDPVANQVATRELINIMRTNPALIAQIEQRVGAMSATDAQWGLRNPKLVGTPSGNMYEAGNQVIGQPGPVSAVGAGLGQVAGALAGLGQALTPKTTNDFQAQIRIGGDRLAGLLQMRDSYKMENLTVPGRAIQGIRGTVAGWFPSAIKGVQKDDYQNFVDFRTTVASFFRDFATSEGGKALTKTEIDTILPITPTMKDDPYEFESKWKRAVVANAFAIARASYFLKKGLINEGNVGAALAQEPQLKFTFRQGGLSQGERAMLDIMQQREDQLAIEMRAQAARTSRGPINDAAISQQAEAAALQEFGLPPNFGDYLRGMQ